MIKKQFLKFLLLIILFFYLRKFLINFNKNKENYNPITTMKTKYNKIKKYCSSKGINCTSKYAYDNARDDRMDDCKISIRKLKEHCLENPSIINRRKCRRVFYWKWRRNQRRKLPKKYNTGCKNTS